MTDHPLDLEELERLAKAATPGPWTATTDAGPGGVVPPGCFYGSWGAGHREVFGASGRLALCT